MDRGCQREEVFQSDDNRRLFLETLGQAFEEPVKRGCCLRDEEFRRELLAAVDELADSQDSGEEVRQSSLAKAGRFHTPMGTPTVRRVRARGLQERGSVVGCVPSRGVQRCEISGIGAGRPSALGGGHGVVSPHESIHSATGGAWDPVGFSGAAGTLFLEWADRPTISTERFVSRLDRRR